MKWSKPADKEMNTGIWCFQTAIGHNQHGAFWSHCFKMDLVVPMSFEEDCHVWLGAGLSRQTYSVKKLDSVAALRTEIIFTPTIQLSDHWGMQKLTFAISVTWNRSQIFSKLPTESMWLQLMNTAEIEKLESCLKSRLPYPAAKGRWVSRKKPRAFPLCCTYP